MTKKGFTLMELLVSIFISGMVMMALVAMWKTSSTQTAEAQRQSIIKNENTIFLRKIYSDFVSASEIICPSDGRPRTSPIICPNNTFISVKEAVISSDTAKLNRTTAPICGEDHNKWSDAVGGLSEANAMAGRCIKPSYTVYLLQDNMIYKCHDNFLTGETETSISILGNNGLLQTATNYCNVEANREMIMPYVQNFSLSIPNVGSSNGPELLIDYTIKRDFGEDIPPVYFKFKRFLTKKGGA